MNKIFKLLYIALFTLTGSCFAQNTPIDAVSDGPHLFFDAKNIVVKNDATPSIDFDIFMSASQAYVNYLTANGPSHGFQSVDVAYNVDFGTDGTSVGGLGMGALSNTGTIQSNQIATLQSQLSLTGAPNAGFDAKFKYTFSRNINSDPLTVTPTKVASVTVTFPAGTIIGTVENGARIQLRCAATGYPPGPSGSKWGDFNGKNMNIVGAVDPRTQPLPVTLTSFNVSKESTAVNLTWSTTEETNSDRFDVQRSGDGKEWNTIQTVAAKGESKSLVEYAAVDNDPLEGANLYRLHMIDKDGTSAYSRIRNVKFEGVSTYMFPNPVAEELIIKAADWSKVANVKIVGSNGREVYHSAGKPSPNVNVKNLSNGIYLVHLTNINGSAATYKIVVNK